MEKLITKPLTLSGRYFSKKELTQVCQIIKLFPNLSLTELAQTLCEHINWVTPKGRNKINSCLTALEKLEQLGYITLPEKRPQKKRETKKIIYSKQTQEGIPIECLLEDLGSIQLKIIQDKEDADLWKSPNFKMNKSKWMNTLLRYGEKSSLLYRVSPRTLIKHGSSADVSLIRSCWFF